MTVAAFMELALYYPELGYYARAARRSGRAGDFFTSVDVGMLFGELLAVQIAEAAKLIHREAAKGASHPMAETAEGFDLVEAGAGDGRLSADIVRAIRRADPALYDSLRLHLVEASATARAAHHDTLGEVADRLVASGAALPDAFQGVLVANELLDAMPVHQIVMGPEGLRERYVGRRSQPGAATCQLTTVEGRASTPALQEYLDALGIALEPGWRAEINLAAVDWIRRAARSLRRGFIILIDYGHEARDLYSASHSAGTLTSFSGHRAAGADTANAPPWLLDPGERDITAHVDFTSVRAAAEAAGLTTIALLDQTYFLISLLDGLPNPHSVIRNPQFKTLIVPGGLGSTMKVLILGKGVGTPALKGTSFSRRAT
jgi:SAM-dependent MidA family methyltransferase